MLFYFTIIKMRCQTTPTKLYSAPLLYKLRLQRYFIVELIVFYLSGNSVEKKATVDLHIK